MDSLNARLKFAAGAVLTLAVGVVGLWAWFHWLDSMAQNAPTADVATALSGSLVLTYAEMSPETGMAILMPATFKFEEGQPYYVDTDGQGKLLTGIHHSISSNGEWIAFINDDPDYVPAEEDVDSVWPNAIYRAAVPEGSFTTAVTALSKAEVAGYSNLAAFPSVSDEGKVLYMSSNNTLDFYKTANAEEWDIVLTDVDNEASVLTRGSQPRWLGNDSFLFLKNDGVYLHSLASGTEVLLMRGLLPVDSFTQLSVDQNGQQVLLVEPGAGAVRMFDVVSGGEAGVSLREKDPIMVKATSAVFSPDGQRVAVSAFSQADESLPMSLQVYQVGGQRLYEAPLPNTSVTFTSLQAWLP